MCFLLRRGDDALLLDAGSGVARLLEPRIRELLGAPARLDIVLSHYHLDHVVGLSYLPGVARGTPLRIFAPAPPLNDAGPEALGRLIGPPLFPVPFERWPMSVEVVPYDGEELEAGGFRCRARRQDHPGGSVGLRLEDALAYVTDTRADEATIPFVRGVSRLLHEVWSTDEEAAADDPGRAGHSPLSAVARIAREAGVGELLPVHHRPGRSDDELAAMTAALEREAGLPVRLPREGSAVEIPG